MVPTIDVLQQLWASHQLPENALQRIVLTGAEPGLPGSFATGTAAQASIAGAAAAALLVADQRGAKAQTVQVDLGAAALECTGHFRLDGRVPDLWAPLSGLYQCRDGWIRVHANFSHHRDAALHSLELPPGDTVHRDTLAAALAGCESLDVEARILAAGGAVAALRSQAQWLATPQAAALADLPLVEITRTADCPPPASPPLPPAARPLHGIRVVDMTRILAGPVCGRTLAAYGARVMLLNAPHLPNIEAIADTSRGKLSATLDLRVDEQLDTLHALLADSRVLVQGYRPGALRQFGLDPQRAGERHPGLICTVLSAYGRVGPWAARRGFDSLVQMACGLNHDEAQAHRSTAPQALPVQILDYASGFLMAFGTQVALYRQRREGGSWHVEVSLARTAQWLRDIGRMPVDPGFSAIHPAAHLQPYVSTFGKLEALPHAADFSATPARWNQASSAPGTHPPRWPVAADPA